MAKQTANQERQSGTAADPRESELTVERPGDTATSHDDISAVAYERWLSRGQPEGSDQEDWFEAERQVREHADGRA